MESKAIRLRELMAKPQEELKELHDVTIEGWVKTNRNNGKVGFLHMHDALALRICRSFIRTAYPITMRFPIIAWERH